MWMPGATAGEEDLVSLALIGKQGVSGHLRVFIDSTLRTLFTANTECEVTIVCVGATITGSYKRQVTLTIPHFKIPTIAFNEEGSHNRDATELHGRLGLEGLGFELMPRSA